MDFLRFHLFFGTWEVWRFCKTLLQSCEDTDLSIDWLEDEISFSQFSQIIFWCDETREGKMDLSVFLDSSSLLPSQQYTYLAWTKLRLSPLGVTSPHVKPLFLGTEKVKWTTGWRHGAAQGRIQKTLEPPKMSKSIGWWNPTGELFFRPVHGFRWYRQLC